MKSQNYLLFLVSFAVLLFWTSCDPADENNNSSLPVLFTSNATFIGENSIKIGGDIASNGGNNIVERGICWSASSTTPTTGDNKSVNGTGIGSYTITLTGLTAGTKYYIRAFATNSSGTGYGSVVKITTLNLAGNVIDNDGNTIKAINIGSQTWMAENLKSLKYRTGEMISNLTTPTDWNKATFGACCYYNNDVANAKYGMLYNWAAVIDSRNITPKGWHVATDAEWTTLINYLGPDSAGAKLKEMGFDHWNAPNTGATNLLGFSALAGGLRYPDGSFGDIKEIGYWWTATEYDASNVRYWYMNYNKTNTHKDYESKLFGRSIRCVKDTE